MKGGDDMKKNNKWVLWVLIALAVIIVIGGLIFYFSDSINLSPSNSKYGSIYVTSVPSSASVSINGIAYKQLTPIRISNITPGNKVIKISKSGYLAYTTNISVTAGSTTGISVNLTAVVNPCRSTFTGWKVNEEIDIRSNYAPNYYYIELLNVPINSGNVTIPILYGNWNMFNGTGKSPIQRLAVTDNNTMYYNATSDADYRFIASWTNENRTVWESYYLKAKVIRGDFGSNITEVYDAITGSKVCEYDFNGIAGICIVGNIGITINSVNYAKKLFSMTLPSEASFNKIYTRLGETIYLTPISSAKTSYNIVFREKDNRGMIGAGKGINITASWTNMRPSITLIYPAADTQLLCSSWSETGNYSRIFENYISSSYQTRILHNKTDMDSFSVKLQEWK